MGIFKRHGKEHHYHLGARFKIMTQDYVTQKVTFFAGFEKYVSEHDPEKKVTLIPQFVEPSEVEKHKVYNCKDWIEAERDVEICRAYYYEQYQALHDIYIIPDVTFMSD